MGKDGRWRWTGGTETEVKEEEVRDGEKKRDRRWWKAEENRDTGDGK